MRSCVMGQSIFTASNSECHDDAILFKPGVVDLVKLLKTSFDPKVSKSKIVEKRSCAHKMTKNKHKNTIETLQNLWLHQCESKRII